MRNTLLTISLIAFFSACVSAHTSAENRKDVKGHNRTTLSTEWGLVAGVSYPWMNCDVKSVRSSLSISSKMGFSAGFYMALRFGKAFALQPEIIYNYSPVRLNDSPEKFNVRMKAQSIQVPVLLSVRVWALRFNVGPVITLMDNPTYTDKEGEKVMFGRIHPTLTYTAGVGVRLMRHLLVDLRYYGGFNDTTNFISYSNASDKGFEFKSSTHSVQLKIGYLF